MRGRGKWDRTVRWEGAGRGGTGGHRARAHSLANGGAGRGGGREVRHTFELEGRRFEKFDRERITLQLDSGRTSTSIEPVNLRSKSLTRDISIPHQR